MKIGVIREGKTPPDHRVPFIPEQCAALSVQYPEASVEVQSSKVRCFRDVTYENVGIDIVDQLESCDVIFGVKEVPFNMLIPKKTYFFFSHTIKKQPYNRELLQEVLKRKIRLIDYECLVDNNGSRVLGFGRFAGIVGAYNAFRAWGLRYDLYDLKPANKCEDYAELVEELENIHFAGEAPKIVLTGGGRVAQGAMELLDEIGILEVSPEDYLNQTFDEATYTQLNVMDYVKKSDGTETSQKEFFSNPSAFESDFMKYAKVSDMYIAGHYWEEGSPFIFSRADAKHPDFNISVVADISCDIDGPVASTLRPSTIPKPFYGYHASSEKEGKPFDEENITVMAVDNLPCELPVDASEHFGMSLMEHVIPALFGDVDDAILERATIAQNGTLTERYSYLQGYVDGKE